MITFAPAGIAAELMDVFISSNVSLHVFSSGILWAMIFRYFAAGRIHPSMTSIYSPLNIVNQLKPLCVCLS